MREGAAIAQTSPGKPRGRRSSIRADWNKRAEPCVAQVQATPEQDPEIDTKQHVSEKRTADAHVRRHRTAEIAGKQNGAGFRVLSHPACFLSI